MDKTRVEMLKLAKEYVRNAYAPYSSIRVSSVAYGCGKMFPGVNVENASYGLTVCAERVAIFRMVSEGCRKLDRLVVYSEDVQPYPCGACLQVISEFSDDPEILIVGPEGEELFKLSELLPKRFVLRDK